MTDKLPVKEHLRNASLYRPVTEPSLIGNWKERLLRQYNMSKQINDALNVRIGMLKRFVYIGVPIACILFALTVYFGFIQPGDWLENTVSAIDWNIPPIGLKEVFIFVAAVNGLTFLVRKRAFV